MKPKGAQPSKKAKKSNLPKNELNFKIEEFFIGLSLLFKGSNDLVEAACSANKKIRERSQYFLLKLERYSDPQSELTPIKEKEADYLRRCYYLAEYLNCPIEKIITPKNAAVKGRLEKELNKICFAPRLKREIKKFTKEAKLIAKPGMVLDNRLEAMMKVAEGCRLAIPICSVAGMPCQIDPFTCTRGGSPCEIDPSLLLREVDTERKLHSFIDYYNDHIDYWHFFPSLKKL